ncbi:hypothetical protein SH2C18_20620 [Clostridium sediminicola]|uniref:hypothetical protein n=1 Tax=Clostridium sediminicola TaxID=3114879 RepID=UPI0031F1E4CB
MKRIFKGLFSIIIVVFIASVFIYTFMNKTEVTEDNITATLKNHSYQEVDIEGKTAYSLYKYTSGFKQKSRKSNVSLNEIRFYVDNTYLYSVEFSDPTNTEKNASIIEIDDEYYKVDYDFYKLIDKISKKYSITFD